MTLSYFEINFDAILNGALGETEATAARKWLEAGKVVYPPPPGLQTTDAVGATDTRVIEEDHSAAAHKARRKSDEGRYQNHNHILHTNISQQRIYIPVHQF